MACNEGERSACGVWLEMLKEEEHLEELGVETHRGTKYQTSQGKHSWRKISLQIISFSKVE